MGIGRQSWNVGTPLGTVKVTKEVNSNGSAAQVIAEFRGNSRRFTGANPMQQANDAIRALLVANGVPANRIPSLLAGIDEVPSVAN